LAWFLKERVSQLAKVILGKITFHAKFLRFVGGTAVSAKEKVHPGTKHGITIELFRQRGSRRHQRLDDNRPL
jgi:hypothetical protein